MGRLFCSQGVVAFVAPTAVANSPGLCKEAHLPSAEFWYEFASTYSYPAALRVAGSPTRGA